jgi:hypothetical protein
MIASLLAQHDSETPVVLWKTNPRNVAKHAAACEKASKAYLRAIYGRQPATGKHSGWIRSITAEGSIVTVEIYFYWGSPVNGTFELPLHVFKQGGKPLTCSTRIEDVVRGPVKVTVTDRYKFNGILLSNVAAIEVQNKPKPVGGEHALSGLVLV